MTGFRAWFLLLALVSSFPLVAPGCDQPPSSEPDTTEVTAATGSPDGFTVRDSADIEIIENHAPERSSDRFWAIDPEPVIVLGDDGTRGEIPAADSAHLVWRLSGYARLADGRVALLSYESARLMLFEPSGRFSKFIGRKGRGPGEFQRPEHLQYLPPDTLVVWDERFSTVAYFDTTGALLRHRRLDYGRIVAALRPLGRRVTGQSQPLPDGSFVAWVAGEGRIRRTPPPPPPWVRPVVEFVRFDSVYAPHSFGWWGEVRHFGYPDHFWVTSDIEGGGDPLSVYVTNGDQHEIQQFSPGGRLLRIIRRASDPIPVTEEEIRKKEEEWLSFQRDFFGGDTIPGVEELWSQTLANFPPQPFHPPIGDLEVDREGYVWVKDSPRQWSVFSPEGRWLGAVKLPVEVNPGWIEKDLLLGGRWGEYGVSIIEGFRLRRQVK